MIDYEQKNISVYKRLFLRYQKQNAKKFQDAVFAKANEYAYTPLLLDCSEGSSEPIYPEITRLTDDGFKVVEKDSLVRKDYYITVHRVTDAALKTRLMRSQAGLPQHIKSAQDSIARVISSWCPYSVALNHKKQGRLNYLHYGISDELLSARILAVTDANNVFIRVDCEKWAEVVQFAPDGAFLNRFIFNTQQYTDRKDLVVVGKSGSVAEQDWESGQTNPEHFVWRLQSSDKKHSME